MSLTLKFKQNSKQTDRQTDLYLSTILPTVWSSLTVTKKQFFWAFTLIWNQWAISHFLCIYWYDIWLSLITFRWNSFQHAFTTTGIWSVIFRKKNIVRDISWSCSLLKCRYLLKYLYQKNVIVLSGNGRTSASSCCVGMLKWFLSKWLLEIIKKNCSKSNLYFKPHISESIVVS